MTSASLPGSGRKLNVAASSPKNRLKSGNLEFPPGARIQHDTSEFITAQPEQARLY